MQNWISNRRGHTRRDAECRSIFVTMYNWTELNSVTQPAFYWSYSQRNHVAMTKRELYGKAANSIAFFPLPIRFLALNLLQSNDVILEYIILYS